MPIARCRSVPRSRAVARFTDEQDAVRVEARERDRREVVELGVAVARRLELALRLEERGVLDAHLFLVDLELLDQRLDVFLREELRLELPDALEKLLDGWSRRSSP